MHLQENYEMEERYFLLSHYYSIHHFSILLKRLLALCLNVVSKSYLVTELCIAFKKDLSYMKTS